VDQKRVKVYSQKKGLKVIINQSAQEVEEQQASPNQPTVVEGWECLQEAFSKIWHRLTPVRKKISWSLSKHPLLKKKKKTISHQAIKMFLSIIGAILLGLIMGGALLQLFFSDQPARLSSIDSNLPRPSQTTVDQPLVSEELPSLKVFLLQAGNYSDKQGAQGKVKTLKDQGKMAVMSQQAPYRIFVGIGSSRDEALKLSFTHRGDLEIFLKEWSVGGGKLPNGLQQKEAQANLAQTLQTGHNLLYQLSQLSAKQVGQNQQANALSAIDQKFLTQYQQWLADLRQLEASLPAQTTYSLEQMKQGMEQAVQSAKKAIQTPDPALWWQTQEGLILYVMGYEHFTQTIG
jgi:stage II sporulation protein B